MDIGELIKAARSVLEANRPELLPHFKVIIAHFAQGNIGDEEVYNTIVQPNTYGDLSMLHGEGAGNFFEDFRKWFVSNKKETVDNRKWSEYLLYGSDYPYFGDVHAQKLMIYIINKRFFDGGGTIEDTRNILGLNQIRLLPEYNLPQMKKEAKNLPSIMVSNPNFQQNKKSAYDIAIEALAKLLVENKININKFCIQFNESWNKFTDDVLLGVVKNSTKEEINLYLKNLVEDQSISLLAPLQSNMEWKKFDYKFFDPEARAFFASLFKQTYLANDANKAFETLSQIF